MSTLVASRREARGYENVSDFGLLSLTTSSQDFSRKPMLHEGVQPIPARVSSISQVVVNALIGIALDLLAELGIVRVDSRGISRHPPH